MKDYYQITSENYILRNRNGILSKIPIPLKNDDYSVVSSDYIEYEEWLSKGNIPSQATVLNIKEESEVFIRKLEEYYDKMAQMKNYDNRYTCALRAAYPGPFKNEGTAFGIWMDECNRKCYEIFDNISRGESVPITFEELVDQLPKLDWNLT